MNITSMLSTGYLEPSVKKTQSLSQQLAAKRVEAREKSASSTAKQSSLANQERSVLAQEKALKASAGSGTEVYTVYQYSVGADGRRYITGASVTMKGDAADLNRTGGGFSTQEIQPKQSTGAEKAMEDTPDLSMKDGSTENVEKREEKSPDAKAESGAKAKEQAQSKEESPEVQAQVQELQQIEREVVAHEAAHMAVAGALGGGVSYSYTQGPDGKKYITGGEVPIQIKGGSTPEETLRNMQQVQSAALAPADPSGQDRQVAARAASIAAQTRSQMAAENAEKMNGAGKSGKDDDKSVKNADKPEKGADRPKVFDASADKSDEKNSSGVATVAKGTPVAGVEPGEQDPSKKGVAPIAASIRASRLLSQVTAA